jgi:ATP diphosphatase
MNKKDIFKESMDLQIKARDIGLDWLEIDGVITKLKEETQEVQAAIKNKDKEAIREELGDLFFTFLCLTRHLKVNPQEILDNANIKFEKRFNHINSILKEQGKSFANPKEMEKLWQIIKNKKN